jgi:hypothetical protein
MRYNSHKIPAGGSAVDSDGQADFGFDHPPEQQTGAADADSAASGAVQEAVRTAERIAEDTGGLGRPGRPMNRRSPFFIGMTATAGVAVTVGVIELLLKAGSILGGEPGGRQLAGAGSGTQRDGRRHQRGERHRRGLRSYLTALHGKPGKDPYHHPRVRSCRPRPVVSDKLIERVGR